MTAARRSIGTLAAVIAIGAPTVAAVAGPQDRDDRLAVKLADAFRVDATRIDITYDWHPGDRVRGRATMRFRMRPGETRPIFHFNPLRHSQLSERELLRKVRLDGRPIDPDDDRDLRVVRTAPGAEPAFEIQRRIRDGGRHVLRVSWSMPKPAPPRARNQIYANFDDTEGPNPETESMWPQISSPDELARHRIHLRVHAARHYRVLGSGIVQRREHGGAVQGWEVDSRRPISASTFFFAAVPAARFESHRFEAGAVPVRIVTDQDRDTLRRARATTRATIRSLQHDLGPFPVPRLQILLTGWDSGMEYYGATRTGIGSLAHELGHMYFGTTAVNRTWRDTWFDESAVVWWQRHRALQPVDAGFRSAIGSGRPPAAPGFDERAYGAGARVLESIARKLGGDRRMMRFLADLHSRREFKPFTTDDLIDDVVAAADGKLTRARLERWLLGR